jgi:DNA repair protein RecN (Recombination protein N)
MLRSLAIHNFVLFEDLDVEFGKGLNVVSGETGGGKSNLTQALALLGGARARKDQIRKGTDGAEIRGVFDRNGSPVEIRRWIPPSGSGRATINGEASPLSDLRRLGNALLSITGQHEQISLTDPSAHMRILDQFGRLESRLEEYRASWSRCQDILSTIEKLRAAEKDREVRQDFLGHQIKEIRSARPRPGEDASLERDILVLGNAERIRRGLSSAHAILYEDEGSAVERVGLASREIEKLSAFMNDLGETRDGLAEASALLEDVSRTLSSRLESLDLDPAALESLQERAFLLDRLKKKHGPSLDDVIRRLADMQTELEELESLETRIRAGEKELEAEAGRAREHASILTGARRRASGRFTRAITSELEKLAFDTVEFRISIEERGGEGLLAGLDQDGRDDVRFLFRPNVGEDLAPLDAIASGGELSRVFLAIRSVLGRGDPDEVLVFDEADTGIGGKTADALGLMLRDLGRRQQVVCVTHLAQIAAHADTHLLVEKTTERGRTRSTARKLDPKTRRDELARMLGGEKVTKKTRDAASELLRLARGKTEG